MDKKNEKNEEEVLQSKWDEVKQSTAKDAITAKQMSAFTLAMHDVFIFVEEHYSGLGYDLKHQIIDHAIAMGKLEGNYRAETTPAYRHEVDCLEYLETARRKLSFNYMEAPDFMKEKIYSELVDCEKAVDLKKRKLDALESGRADFPDVD